MGEHTPGQWRVSTATFSDADIKELLREAYPVVLYGPNVVALTWDAADGGDAEALANATLIAAAPQMKEALEGLVRTYEAHTDGFARQVLRRSAENAKAILGDLARGQQAEQEVGS